MSRIFNTIIFLALLSVVGCDDSMLSDHPVDKLMADQEIAGVIYGLTYAAYMSQAPVTVSGRVVLCSLNNTGNPNVRIYVHGIFENLSATTNANGNFTINGIRPGDFTVSASRQGYTFEPSLQAIKVTASGVTDVNFETMVTWDRKIGGSSWDRAYSVKQLRNDCGYIVSGYSDSHSPGNFDWYVVRLDMNGNVVSSGGDEWAKRFGGSNTDIAYSAAQDGDNNFVIAGSSESIENNVAGLSDFWVVKVDEDGDQLWEQTYGSAEWDEARSVIATSDGNYAVAGSNASLQGAGLADFRIIKINASNGSILWEYSHGTTESDKAFAIVEDVAESAYLTVGNSNIPLGLGGGSEITVVRLQSDGDLDWTQIYSNGLYNEAYGITTTADGYVIAGFTKKSDFDHGSVMVMKIAKDGDSNPLWLKVFDYDNVSAARSIKLTRDGGFIVAGYVLTSENDYDMLLIKLNATGDKQWERLFNGSNNWEDRGYEVQETSDGGYILAGYTEVSHNKDDMWVLKLNSRGEIVQ